MSEQRFTYPRWEDIQTLRSRTPEFMHPNMMPYAVGFESFLTPNQCDDILEFGMKIEPYEFQTCGAVTREYERPLHKSLELVETLARTLNSAYFEYDLSKESPAAWLQTYSVGGDYRIHIDGMPGQTRKLTAVVMLSDDHSYWGGELEMINHPDTFKVPSTRGTVVVFQPWLYHHVQPVTKGLRQTINMGFYGPPFK